MRKYFLILSLAIVAVLGAVAFSNSARAMETVTAWLEIRNDSESEGPIRVVVEALGSSVRPEGSDMYGNIELEIPKGKTESVEFKFTEPEDHLYRVRQIPGDDSRIEYDEKTFFVEFFVYVNEVLPSEPLTYAMAPYVAGESQKAEDVSFENVLRRGNVIVKHITTTGEILDDWKDVKRNAPIGEDYETSVREFPGYEFVYMDPESDPAKGTVIEGTLEVIYVYQQVGNVIVKHITTTGEVLKDWEDVKRNAPIGEEYDTHTEEFPGYQFVYVHEISDPVSGQVVPGTLEVIYVYEPIPEPKTGNVIVKHITTTGEVLKDWEDVKRNAPIGEEYDTHTEEFPGYKFVYVHETSDPVSGQVIEGTLKVIYVYEPEEISGNVIVKHITTTGEVLKDWEDVKRDAPIGEEYDTHTEEFPGYEFVYVHETSDPVSGQVVPGTLKVIYVYHPIPEPETGNVIVKHITTTGEVLKDWEDVKRNAPIGEDYDTHTEEFPGYKFVYVHEASDPVSGQVVPGTLKVIYVYEPEVISGNVIVKHITTDGKVLEDWKDVKRNAPIGEEYITTVKEFPGYRFVRMDPKSADAAGKVQEGTLEIIYVYERIPASIPDTGDHFNILLPLAGLGLSALGIGILFLVKTRRKEEEK